MRERRGLVLLALFLACSANGNGGDDDAALASGGTGGTGAPQCTSDGHSCVGDPSSCCAGLMCLNDATLPIDGTCTTICQDGSDCHSGCCVEFEGALDPLCAPGELCACIVSGEDCAGNADGCCNGSTCVDSANGPVCTPTCKNDSECASGCCAKLHNLDLSVCGLAEDCP